LNIARAGGSDLDLLLRRFGVERLLFRISQSEFADAFVLKGAMLFIVWGESLPRPTRDVDLLAFGPSGIGAVAARFREIREVDVIPDGLEFDATMLSVEPIREDNDYGGLRVAVVARLGSAALGRDRAERRRLIERKLSELREEQRRLEEELHELEYVPTASAARVCAIPAPPATPAAKVALFLELFGARARSIHASGRMRGRPRRATLRCVQMTGVPESAKSLVCVVPNARISDSRSWTKPPSSDTCAERKRSGCTSFARTTPASS